MAFIELKDVSFSYSSEEDEKISVIKNINLQIEKGSFVSIIGHNGSGKSTLAKLLNLILVPDSGEIYIDGKNISSNDLNDEELFDIRKKIGMVFQNPDNQLVAMVVEEDIAFGPENLGMDPSEIRKRVDNSLALVGMEEFAKHSPHQLSGGQKQRIAIAGVIAMEPECIVFDESTAMLDPIGRRDIMNIIKKLNKDKGITVLHITHNMDEAIMCDRVVVMDDGEICMDGTPREVFSNVEKLHSVGLDVPQVTELAHNLQKLGVNINANVLTNEEFLEEIKGYVQ